MRLNQPGLVLSPVSASLACCNCCANNGKENVLAESRQEEGKLPSSPLSGHRCRHLCYWTTSGPRGEGSQFEEGMPLETDLLSATYGSCLATLYGQSSM
ncbi:hypothetical protein ACLKA6_001717 [Drosophila palustris]